MSTTSEVRAAMTRRAAGRIAIERLRPARIARALFWLALERAADTPSVTRASRTYRRSVSVTLCRASLGLLAVWVFVVVWPGAAHPAAGVDPRPFWAAAPVLVYLLSAGLAIDHFGARYGAAALFGFHLLGVALFLPVMSTIALANPSLDATRFGQSTITLAVAWPMEFVGLVVASYALAWFVPGSLPRQFRFTREAWSVARNVESAPQHRPLPLTEARSEAAVAEWE